MASKTTARMRYLDPERDQTSAIGAGSVLTGARPDGVCRDRRLGLVADVSTMHYFRQAA